MNEKDALFTEKWECSICGSPCRVEITYSDDKLPEHLKAKTRFRNRICPCKESYPVWQNIVDKETVSGSVV